MNKHNTNLLRTAPDTKYKEYQGLFILLPLNYIFFKECHVFVCEKPSMCICSIISKNFNCSTSIF